MWNLKKKKTQTHKYREQIVRCGGWVKVVIGVKRVKLPVRRYIRRYIPVLGSSVQPGDYR